MTSAFSAGSKPRYRLARYAASLWLLIFWSASADARSLETVIERGALTLCASPNALPFASKTGPVPGFQIELGEKIAQQLGVKLTREWVVSAIQYRRADCDLVLDVIARKDTPPGRSLVSNRNHHFRIFASLWRPQLDAVAGIDPRDGAIRQQRLDCRIDALSQLVVGPKQPGRNIPVQVLVVVERRNQAQRVKTDPGPCYCLL